eukprot:COSAG03_NODE_4153_length_1661_cov_1.813060_1_plen_49_part_10
MHVPPPLELGKGPSAGALPPASTHAGSSTPQLVVSWSAFLFLDFRNDGT